VRVLDRIQMWAHSFPGEGIRPDCIAVDSIAAAVRGAESGERAGIRVEFIHTLKRVAAKSGISILVTNHMAKIPRIGAGAWANMCPTRDTLLATREEREWPEKSAGSEVALSAPDRHCGQ
jgi:hypothetical protein